MNSAGPVLPAWRRHLFWIWGGISLLGALAGLIWVAIAIWWPILPTLALCTAFVYLIDRARR